MAELKYKLWDRRGKVLQNAYFISLCISVFFSQMVSSPWRKKKRSKQRIKKQTGQKSGVNGISDWNCLETKELREKVVIKSLQSFKDPFHVTYRTSGSLPCPSVHDLMDCSLPGSSVYGILQATILKWEAIPFSRGSSPPRDWTHISMYSRQIFSLNHQGSPQNTQNKLIPQSCA